MINQNLLLQFSNLILDDTVIQELSAEDKEYLESFENLEKLSLNQT